MMGSERNDREADRFLKEGLPNFLPAVRALGAFIHEIESRIRKVLEPYDQELNRLGIASSSRLNFSPKLGEEPPEQVIEVGIRNPDRSGFYIYIDLSDTPSQPLYVGFWMWTPASQDRKTLFRELAPIWDTERYETELSDSLYVGSYLNAQQYFPGFEDVLDKLVQHVIAGLNRIDFAGRFAAGFRRVHAQATRGEIPDPT